MSMIGGRGVRSMASHTCVRSMASHTCVRQLNSQVKGDKHERGMEGMRGVGSVIVPHTCVSTHLGLKGD